jgi:hypothetical protein
MKCQIADRGFYVGQNCLSEKPEGILCSFQKDECLIGNLIAGIVAC